MAKQTQAQKTMEVLNSVGFQAKITELALQCVAMVNETDADKKQEMCKAFNKAQCDLAYANKMMPQLVMAEVQKAKRLVKVGA